MESVELVVRRTKIESNTCDEEDKPLKLFGVDDELIDVEDPLLCKEIVYDNILSFLISSRQPENGSLRNFFWLLNYNKLPLLKFISLPSW